MKKDLISIQNLTSDEIENLFTLASELKRDRGKLNNLLAGKSLGLLFEKSSTRTRVSFEVGMYQLGGNSIFLRPDEVQLKRGETLPDTAKVLSRYLDGIVLRTYSQEDVETFVSEATIPVINGLSDKLHPCQALSDYFTLQEKFKDFEKIKFAYIGDGNNVCHSLLHGAGKLGIDIWVASPKGYEPDKQIRNEAEIDGQKSGAKITITNNPEDAAENADCIYTDVWISMGQEKIKGKKIKDFVGFQVNKKLVSLAKKDCLVMHCLPAHRGEEITDEIMDSKNSIVWDQAENRLHLQKAILVKLLGDNLK